MNKESRGALQKAEGFARDGRIRISLDNVLPFRTLHLGPQPARGAGQEMEGCLAVPLKEHGQTNLWCGEGSQEPQEKVGCAGCRARPPHYSACLGTH